MEMRRAAKKLSRRFRNGLTAARKAHAWKKTRFASLRYGANPSDGYCLVGIRTNCDGAAAAGPALAVGYAELGPCDVPGASRVR